MCMYQYFVLFLAEYYSILWTFCYLFIADGHLGCLHLFTIMNIAAVNIHVSFWVDIMLLFLLSICLGVQFLGHMLGH